jgi:hypothetical protein
VSTQKASPPSLGIAALVAIGIGGMVGCLLATTVGTLVIVNAVNIDGISLMGSAGFLIIFAAVNLSATRLLANTRLTATAAIGGALACVGCLGALIAYAATHIPGQLGVLAGLLGTAILGEAILRRRRARGTRRQRSTVAS